MQINITLKDPKSCEGCYLKEYDEYNGHSGWHCYTSPNDGLTNYRKTLYCFRRTLKRPQRCVQENGL